MPNKKKTPVKKVIKKANAKSSTKKSVDKKIVIKKRAKKKLTSKKVTVSKSSLNKASPKKKIVKKKAITTKGVTKKSVKKRNLTKKKLVLKKEVDVSKSSEENSNEDNDLVQINKPILSRPEVVEYKKPAPIALSIDEIEEMMAAKKTDESTSEEFISKSVETKPKAKKEKKHLIKIKSDKKRVLGAASLSDILGFNPNQRKKESKINESQVPKKWSRYYKLLIELRAHVSDELSLHTSETLGHSSREDSGDLSNFGSHQADAGTDTFDRDFALSLVSSEHDALNEIEEAIIRIKDGTFGICEVTNKRIPAARLTAVPFTRFSVEGQAEHEKNKGHRTRRNDTPSIFGDVSDAPKLVSSDDDDE